MNKFLSRFSTALISLSLAVGIGVSLSSEKGIIRADAGTNLVAKALFGASYNQTNVGSYKSSFVTIVDGFSWNVSNFNNNNSGWNYVKTGNKSAASVGTITTAKEVNDVVTSAYLIIDEITASKVNSIKLLAGADSSNLSEIGSFELSTGTQEIAIPEEVQSANYFYQFSFDCLKGSSNGLVTVSEAGLYSDVATSDTTTSLTVTPSSWTGYNTQTLNVADFIATATTTASDDGYVFQGIGYGTGDKFVARDATFSSGNPLTTDTRLQWKAKYPTTAGGSEYLYAGVDLTVNEDVLSSISVSGSMTKTEYYTSESWDATGLTVTATYASGATASIDSSEITWTYSPEIPAVGVTSVVATAKYNGKAESSSAQTVTVLKGILFDFETHFGNYTALGWSSSYADHTISSSDLRVSETTATIQITGSSKQGSTLTTMPVVKGSTITFSLDASETRVIDTVKVNFVHWRDNKQTISLYKGADITASISSISFPDGGNTISASGLKSNSFTCITSYTSNQIGIKSIVVTLMESSFGTLDHISVSSLPNKTTYCVGEKFVSEGLVVTAYDGADEATASSKEVTDSITLLIDDGYVFNESNVSDPFVVDIEYTEGSISKETSFDIVVVAATNYELVTTAPNDWSGEYLVVTTNNRKLLGLNCSLESPDVASNYVTLTATDNVIATNSSYSITIEKMEGGYSVKSTLHGYYIGGNESKNYLLTNDTVPYLNTITLNDDGSVALTSNTKSLAFNANLGDERFRYYGNGYLSVNLYRRVASSSSSIFADYFINDLHCDATGVTAPSVDEWNTLKDTYAELDAYDQLTFKIAVGNPSGTNIEQAVAKYDYIITKYGVANYVDFMGRVEYGSLTFTNNRIEFADKLDSQSTIICVVVLSLLSVSTIGGYIILKKTKEN